MQILLIAAILFTLGVIVWAFAMMFSKEENKNKTIFERIKTFMVRTWDAITNLVPWDMITDDVRNYFDENSSYLIKKETKTGFQRDKTIRKGTRIRYVSFKYSPYDGCFSCKFKDERTNDDVYFWIQEDMTKAELNETFELKKWKEHIKSVVTTPGGCAPSAWHFGDMNIGKLSREELIKLGHRFLNAKTEIESDRLYDEFKSNFSHPDASNLFFYPENFNNNKDDLSNYNPTVEEVVDAGLAHKSIIL